MLTRLERQIEGIAVARNLLLPRTGWQVLTVHQSAYLLLCAIVAGFTISANQHIFQPVAVLQRFQQRYLTQSIEHLRLLANAHCLVTFELPELAQQAKLVTAKSVTG